MLFGRVSSVQKFFNGYNSYTHIPTQLKAPCLKVSSHGDHMCRTEGLIATKDDQKLTIIDHTDTNNIVKSYFCLDSKLFLSFFIQYIIYSRIKFYSTMTN